ncbi:MAG TPA: gamma-glutamyl-gamma-aminobutyrate hydrolase family protein [Candidatus Lokiarchaeia archaeon]|nr:gamma-glutamyl-gamma-aminobutyrate hydrolase family protein [Candidatus Lokiarchaeia archaeon]
MPLIEAFNVRQSKIVLVNNYPGESNDHGSTRTLNPWKHRENGFHDAFASYLPIQKDRRIKLIVNEVHFTELESESKLDMLNEADGIILSGSPLNISELAEGDEYKRNFDRLEEFIVNAPMAILGICFGHQLIGHAFGFRIDKYAKVNGKYGERNKTGTLQIDSSCDLLTRFMISNTNLVPLCVEWNHEEEIKREHRDDGKDQSIFTQFDEVFNMYGSTPVCEIQVIKHRHRPIYGVQFHPETTSSVIIDGIGPAKQHGILVLQGFLDRVIENARNDEF